MPVKKLSKHDFKFSNTLIDGLIIAAKSKEESLEIAEKILENQNRIEVLEKFIKEYDDTKGYTNAIDTLHQILTILRNK